MCREKSSEENPKTSVARPCRVSIKPQRLLRKTEAVGAKKESMRNAQNASEKNPDESLYFTHF